MTQMCANFSALPSNGIHINSNEGITREESIARVNSLIGQKFENPTSPPTHHTTQVMPAAVRGMLPSISQSYGFRLFFGRKAHSRTINVPTSSFGTPDRRLGAHLDTAPDATAFSGCLWNGWNGRLADRKSLTTGDTLA
jgi:hypothetical protein